MLEGVPSIVMGIVVGLALPDSPKTAKWLTETDKALLAEDVSIEYHTSWLTTQDLLLCTQGVLHYQQYVSASQACLTCQLQSRSLAAIARPG